MSSPSVASTEFYKTSPAIRAGGSAQDLESAAAYFNRYVRFVSSHVERGSAVLELGSSTGMAAAILSRAGYRVVATDVCHPFFRRELRSTTLRFTGADNSQLPFGDGTFDAVASYQVLEHSSDPARALDEMIRVLKPGGRLLVAGPNLIGLVPSARVLLLVLPRTRPLRRWFVRDTRAARYPFGSTYPEVVAVLLKNLWRVVKKLVDPQATFLMRTPDFRDGMHADADSSYLLNPIDIVKYVKGRGFHVERRRGDGPLGFLGPLAGGTWVALRKPASSL